MSETDLEQTEATRDPESGGGEQGELHIAEVVEPTVREIVPTPAPLPASVSAGSVAARQERAGTAEHLAARRPVPPLDVESAEIKQQLAALRIEVTRLLTGLRHEGVSAQATADELIPLLDLGPFLQWSPVLIPFLLEIDRAGNLIPVWLKIIDAGDPTELPPDTNFAETQVGKARRIAILMLGNYRSAEFSEKSAPIGFRPGRSAATAKSDLYKVLGRLALDPNTSLYATQSLVKQGNSPAMQTLIIALKEAEGWAKVDIIEACLKFNQPGFSDFLLASGFERASGLESYIAIPLYRSLPLERYLRGEGTVAPRLSQQVALVVAQVVQDSLKQQQQGSRDEVPPLFERDLPTVVSALFEGTRRSPSWQAAVALHRLGLLLGRYWADISRGSLTDARIARPVAESLPLMPEVERWMNGPGRDVLLHALADADEETSLQIVRVLGDLREPRAISLLLARIDAATRIEDRRQASSLAQMCETLGKLGDLRAVPSLFTLAGRVLAIPARASRPKRRESLPTGDADIPASIVYGAIVRALGQLADRSTVDFLLHASNDFDPYVRTQALEALKRVDPTGELVNSRLTARAALSDPAESVVRIACQLVVQYRDREAIPHLQNLSATRPELAPAAYEALRQFG